MKKAKGLLLILILALSTAIIASCSSSPDPVLEKGILGKWVSQSPPITEEFFSDGTVKATNKYGTVVTGKYQFIGNDRIAVNLDGSPTNFTISISENTLIRKTEAGTISKFERAVDGTSSQAQQRDDSQNPADTQGEDSQNETQQSSAGDDLSNKIIIAGSKDTSNMESGTMVIGYDPNGEESFRHEFPSHVLNSKMVMNTSPFPLRLMPFDATYDNMVVTSSYEIMLVDTAGNERNLTSERYSNGFDDKPKELYPFFTPDHSKIVFWATGGLGKPMISLGEGTYNKGYWFAINPGGSGQTLLFQKGSIDLPCVSPNASKIVFDNRDTSNRFVPTVFSRDGKFFAATETKNWKIVVCSSRGKRLSSTSFGGSIYDWSPKGDSLVAMRAPNFSGKGRNIYLVPVSNGTLGKPIQLTKTQDRENVTPVFSPDGSKIAFLSKKDDLELWVMNCDGTDKKQVATIPTGPGGFDWLRGDVAIMEWNGEE